MPNQPTNPDEIVLTLGISALRAEVPAEAPEAFVASMRSPETPRKRRTAWIWRTAALAACSAVAGLITLWPHESPAAALDRVVAAAQAPVLRREILYHLNPDGSRVVTSDTYLRGRHWHSVMPGQAEEESDGETATYYFASRGYATVERIHRGRPITVSDGTLKRFLNFPQNKHVDVEHGIRWKGRFADKYRIEFEFIDGAQIQQHGYQTIYADPRTDRPMYTETFFDKRPDWNGACEFEYPQVSDDVLHLTVPAGIPVYDLPKQRDEIRQLVLKAPLTAKVGDRVISLHAVVLDEDNFMEVIVSGSDGRSGVDFDRPNKALLEVDGLPSAVQGGAGGMDMRLAGSHYDWFPYPYKGLRLGAELARFPKDAVIPPTFTLHVPVWFDEGQGLKLAGYATFHVKDVLRTSSTLLLLRANNMSILSDAYTEKQAAEGKSSPTISE